MSDCCSHFLRLVASHQVGSECQLPINIRCENIGKLIVEL